MLPLLGFGSARSWGSTPLRRHRKEDPPSKCDCDDDKPCQEQVVVHVQSAPLAPTPVAVPTCPEERKAVLADLVRVRDLIQGQQAVSDAEFNQQLQTLATLFTQFPPLQNVFVTALQNLIAGKNNDDQTIRAAYTALMAALIPCLQCCPSPAL